jgi:hypothetical protein
MVIYPNEISDVRPVEELGKRISIDIQRQKIFLNEASVDVYLM